MTDLRELLQDADHLQNTIERLEREACQKRREIPKIGRTTASMLAVDATEKAGKISAASAP